MEFSRQPRISPEYEIGELALENPPPLGEKPEIMWFQTFIAPIVMLCVTVFVFAAGRSGGGGMMGSPLFLVSSLAMTGVAIIGSIISLNNQFSRHAKQKKRRVKKYSEYIKQKETELELAAANQARVLKLTNPSPPECVQRMNTPPTEICPTDPRIWERTPFFDDFLEFRVGIGAVKAALFVGDPGPLSVMETDPLAGEPRKLALKYERVQDVPIGVNLREAQICGIVGEKAKTETLVNNILIQIAANHGYDNVRVVLLAKEEALKKWDWGRLLPHFWNDSFTARRIICGKDAAKLTLDEVCSELKERASKGGDVVFSSYYVFIVESPEIIEDSPIRKYLYEPNARLGVTAVFTAQHAAFLPARCGAVITLKEKTGELVNIVKNEKNIFTPDKDAARDDAEMGARRVAPLRIKSASANFSLPRSITLCQMLDKPVLTEVDVLSNWRTRRTYDGMAVPIGVRTGGDAVCLDLHETGHGPHGLVAGTTGSGKSELLQSVIISLAIHFHPSDVSFVLIDYKGGGMADVFKGMPHLAGVITNLGGGQTTRALLSIKSEILRRQTVFAEYGVTNIDKYQKLYYKDTRPENMPPVPHLVMIADEFAELQQDQPDFMKQLVSAARVGRSLGIHLILATQKPDGVVDDQIWSNSKFKMCLKVQTESDSNGVLKKPDAAFIREPGRAYLQVGNDEMYELFQSVYSGADYVVNAEEAREREMRDKKIYKLSVDGRPSLIYQTPKEDGAEETDKISSQLEVMVRHITERADSEGIKALTGLWTEPLKETVYYDELPENWLEKPQNSLLSAVAGVVDDPRGQRQIPLEFDFANEGGLLVYGASGTGKTTLLKTLCLSLAYRYTPDEVNIYILDMGGASLKMFSELPHCGGVLTIDQTRDIRQFMRFLFRMTEKRRNIFEEARVEDFIQYKKGGGEMPAVVVIIDAYAPLMETYDDVDERITLFARDAFRFGVYLVITGISVRDIRYKLAANFKMTVAFELIDKSYSELVGRTEGLEPENYCGRGLVKLAKPLEFQAALPEVKDSSTRELIAGISANEQRRAVKIPVMPDRVDFKELNKDNAEKNTLRIGRNDSDLTPVTLDFAEQTSFIITGGASCGKSLAAVTWLTALKDAEIYALDSNGAGFAALAGRSGISYLNDLGAEDLQTLIDSVAGTLDARRTLLAATRRNGGDAAALSAAWKQIIFAFDKFGEASDNDDYYDLFKLVYRIAKREQGMKVMVLALDTMDGFGDDYSDAAKTVKNAQTGLLLGSLKEQSMFDVSLPYGTPEKELAFGDGYFIKKSRFAGIRTAYAIERR
ncbi:type VII secretion protein EssC [Clostridia bacterium]|nr:type VII secretion protein EssC [Clostridia bacterium]